MSRVYNVLVFPGGTEIALEINAALSLCKEINLYSAGMNVSNHASNVFRHHFVIPPIYDSLWIRSLNNIILNHDIDYIFPAYDDVLLALVGNAEKIQAKIISSPLHTCVITRSKLETYKHLSGTIPVPDVYEIVSAINSYPVFVKPDRGQGSQNTFIIKDRGHLEQVLNLHSETIVTEYLPGMEYTVDCFSDREKGLIFSSGRLRTRTRSGISMNSHVVDNNIFSEFAGKINDKLIFHGAWFFQLKKDIHGNFKLLEIAPRIAGTMAVNRARGVNFPLLSIYEQERIPVEILLNDASVEIDRALINRYQHNMTFDSVYVDLDDTLILKGKINVKLIRLLFQFINNDIRIVLLSKHALDINQTMDAHRITGIFDEVIHINKTENKADHIMSKGAILIDDSFIERKAVRDKLGIATFDCSMIEMLMDDRM